MLVLVRLLSWLIVLGVTGGPEHRVSGSGDRIPLDEPPPVVPVLHSQFCKTLEKCPDTDSLKEHRQYCFEPPPRGHVYHCAATDFNGIVEFFYRKFPCRKGCYGIPEVLGYVVEMSCKKCPEDRFNPELRWSPENMDQCRTHYHKALDEHAIEYVPGNSSAPAVSYCNYTDNWASANEEMFCRESYQPCNCVYRGDFCKRLELLPDSSCEPWCDGQRLPKNNFRCTQVELPHTQRSSQITGSNKPTQIASTSRISPGRAPVTDEPTDKVSGVHPKTNDLFPRLIAGIILGCVVIVFLGSLIYNLIARRTSDKNDEKREPLITFTRNYYTNHIRGDSLKFRKNQEVTVTLNRGYEEGSTAGAEAKDLIRGENDDNCKENYDNCFSDRGKYNRSTNFYFSDKSLFKR